MSVNLGMTRWWLTTASFQMKFAQGKHPEGPKTDVCIFPLVAERIERLKILVWVLSRACVNLRMFVRVEVMVGPILYLSSRLLVPSLSIQELKSTGADNFRIYSLKNYYAFFSWGIKYARTTCSIIYHLESFKIESFFLRMVSSFSHENPSWLSKWNLTKWITGPVLSEPSEVVIYSSQATWAFLPLRNSFSW